MKRILTAIAALMCASNLFAQGIDDACRFSQTRYHGTAKALGMGNALGAVGGDMTAVCINPAGMGLYRSNELTASLNLQDNHSHSTYYDTPAHANCLRLAVPNVGYVNTKQRSNYKGLRYTQFGIGLTRTNDYNSHTFAKGLNPTSSKIDNYLFQIDGLSPSDIRNDFPMDIYPAWSTYLINLYQDEQGEYYGSPVPQGNIMQSQENTFKGRSEEWTFAGSANFSDRIFIGISAGLNHVKRIGTREFLEQMPDGIVATSSFSQWTYTESLSSTGWGGNIKMGIIFLANHWLRIGAAFHTPTFYDIDESWQTETESQISWITNKYISPEAHYEYSFVSPLKWMGSLAFIVGGRGIFSLDAEYTNYGAARFLADDYDYSSTNDAIREVYGHTLNFRLGTEWQANGIYLRAGAGFYGSPFGIGQTDGSVQKASVGISMPVSESTTFDFAYELTHGKNRLVLYDAGGLGIEPITQRQFRSNLAATLKIRF